MTYPKNIFSDNKILQHHKNSVNILTT